MSWAGAPHLVGLSEVEGRRANTSIYAFEGSALDRVKIGESRKVSRRLSHGRCMDPSLRCIFSFRAHKKTERDIHDLFDAYRVVPRGTPGHEWFFKSPPIVEWMAACLTIHGGADLDVEYESARTWLERVAKLGSTAARSAACSDLRTDDRLIPIRRKFRGGFVLWEALGGKPNPSVIGGRGDQHVLEFAKREPAKSTFRYKGESYVFHVYHEVCRRYTKNPPPGAIKAGLFPLNHFVRTGRRVEVPRKEQFAADDPQLILPGSR